MKLRLPFRFRYYVVRNKWPSDIHIEGPYKVIRQRSGIMPMGMELVDGPFDYQEDAVHSLSFWTLQQTKITKGARK